MNHAPADGYTGFGGLKDRDREWLLEERAEREAIFLATDFDFIHETLDAGLSHCEALAEILSKYIADPTMGNAWELAGAFRSHIENAAWERATGVDK